MRVDDGRGKLICAFGVGFSVFSIEIVDYICSGDLSSQV